MPLEVRIAELVREQALRLTKEEVPHAVTAEVVEIDDRRVHVRIYIETESQKQILIGKGGTMVREIGRSRASRDRAAARPDDLPPAAGQGRAEVAAQRDDARAARDVAARPGYPVRDSNTNSETSSICVGVRSVLVGLHRVLATRDDGLDRRERRLRLVEVRRDRARRPCGLHRVARAAPGGDEDLLAGGDVPAAAPCARERALHALARIAGDGRACR